MIRSTPHSFSLLFHPRRRVLIQVGSCRSSAGSRSNGSLRQTAKQKKNKLTSFRFEQCSTRNNPGLTIRWPAIRTNTSIDQARVENLDHFQVTILPSSLQYSRLLMTLGSGMSWFKLYVFPLPYSPFWHHMHYGKAMLHIKRGSASGKQLCSSFFFVSRPGSPPDNRALIASFPAIW